MDTRLFCGSTNVENGISERSTETSPNANATNTDWNRCGLPVVREYSPLARERDTCTRPRSSGLYIHDAVRTAALVEPDPRNSIRANRSSRCGTPRAFLCPRCFTRLARLSSCSVVASYIVKSSAVPTETIECRIPSSSWHLRAWSSPVWQDRRTEKVSKSNAGAKLSGGTIQRSARMQS